MEWEGGRGHSAINVAVLRGQTALRVGDVFCLGRRGYSRAPLLELFSDNWSGSSG